MLYQNLCQLLNITADKSLLDLPTLTLRRSNLRPRRMKNVIAARAFCLCDLRDDDKMFRNTFLNENGFDTMRKNHQHRREFSALALAYDGQSEVDWLSNLGFSGVGQ